MEDRQSIYYRGNTVKPPKPSLRNLKRRFKGDQLKKVTVMPYLTRLRFEAKICASSQCVWCGTGFDGYSIRCRVCGNCQYCGRFCSSGVECIQCGNYLPADLHIKTDGRTVRF